MTVSSDPLPAHLERILDDMLPAVESWTACTRRRRRRLRAMAISAAALASLGGVAGAAGIVLGEPAPPSIQQDFTDVNRGIPPELQLEVDAAGAVSVATTGGSTLYLAKVSGGGYCMELATSNVRGRGVGCTNPGQLPIDVMIPHDEPMTTASPVTLAGRVNAASATSLELIYIDGTITTIPFGNELFFVADVPDSMLALAHGGKLRLVARDADGAVVARALIPADWDATAESAPVAPIELSTVSDQDDLTKIFGLRGRVTMSDAVSLRLLYADGEKVNIPLDESRDFDYEIPAERRDDFMRPHNLVALDVKGVVVASTPVAAVAHWQRTKGGG